MNTPRDDRRDDALAARLRRALGAEAAGVQPAGDGLAKIRAGIERPAPRAWWRHPSLALVAAAMVGLVVGGLAVGLGQGGDEGTSVAGHTETPQPTRPASGQPSDTPSSSTSPATTSSAPAPPGEVGVWVYYLRDVEGAGPRLFRERHVVPELGDGRVATAVDEMLGDKAADPDYSSPWTEGAKVLSYVRSGDTATVDLSAFPAVGAAVESQAVQQLVYTVTANDTAVRRVRLLVDGQPPSSGHHDWSQPVARQPVLDVRGLQWILAPAQGSTVSSPVLVQVNGTGFEGHITIKVFRGQTEVASTYVTTEQGALKDGETTVDLPPGTYTVKVYDEYGDTMRLREQDSKTFTVK
jgi:sporulation and spore germination protein/immunoglobulin-like protein involved in spore germination